MSDTTRIFFVRKKVADQLQSMIVANVDSDTGIPCDNWAVDLQNDIIKGFLSFTLSAPLAEIARLPAMVKEWEQGLHEDPEWAWVADMKKQYVGECLAIVEGGTIHAQNQRR